MLSQAARNPLFAALLALFVAGCAGSPAPSPSPVMTTASEERPRTRIVSEEAALVAARQVGVPYRYGGRTRSGFDCSGLVNYAYAQAGIAMPRTTGALWDELEPVPRGQFLTGDVLFFDIAGKISHVGLYLGDGRFVHAPSSGKQVTIASLSNEFYDKALVRGGRPR